MEILTVMLIAVGLAMDAFAVSISNGIAVRGFGRYQAARQGLYFGCFQFIMPLIGFMLGRSISSYIESFDHWIAFVMLSIIGGGMIYECIKDGGGCEAEIKGSLSSQTLFVQAVATSIDALAVGISLGLMGINVFVSSALIGIVAFAFSFAGGMLGKRLCGIFQKKAEFAGGLILIIIGIKILLEHTML